MKWMRSGGLYLYHTQVDDTCILTEYGAYPGGFPGPPPARGRRHSAVGIFRDGDGSDGLTGNSVAHTYTYVRTYTHIYIHTQTRNNTKSIMYLRMYTHIYIHIPTRKFHKTTRACSIVLCPQERSSRLSRALVSAIPSDLARA